MGRALDTGELDATTDIFADPNAAQAVRAAEVPVGTMRNHRKEGGRF